LKNRSIYWYLAVSFIVGIGIGYRENHNHKHKSLSNAEEVLHVLIPNNSIPQDLIESFVSETGYEVQVDTYSTGAEFDKMITQGQYDLALVGFTQVPQLRQEERILPLRHSLLNNFENLSADFRDLPSDPGGLFSVPIYWGIRSPENDRAHLGVQLKSQIPSTTVEAQVLARDLWMGSMTLAKSFKKQDDAHRQNTALWVQSFVVLKNSKKIETAHRMIDYFLEGDVATELAQLTMNSGTNVRLESKQLDATLKPSHLRRQKLASITRVGAR
jgi:spermidine/putrescine-binding protein